jgi:hypothetical protein
MKASAVTLCALADKMAAQYGCVLWGRPIGGLCERNMPFYETNPPFFDEILDVTDYAAESYNGKCLENSVGSFWKTNPI